MIDGRRRRRSTARDGARDTEEPPRTGIGATLVRLGVRADYVTIVGIALAAATAVAVGFGQLIVGVVLLTAGGLMDALDGAVAKAAGTQSPRGAFFDSVADRISDALIFGGVAWYMLNRPDPRLAILPVAILAASALVSYERAKAESLGYTARGGLMERAERLILLGIALFFHVVLVPLLVVLLVLTLATATGRFLRVWRVASGKTPAAAPRLDRSRASVESKWRAWRESGRARPRRRQVEPLATRLRKVLPSPHRDAISARPGSGRRRAADALRTRVHGR